MDDMKIKLPQDPMKVFDYGNLSYEELCERYPTMPDTLLRAAQNYRELNALGLGHIAEDYRNAIIHLISLRLELDGIRLPTDAAIMKLIEDFRKDGAP